MILNRKIELLAPAGSPEALDAAIGEGADAVYLGLKDFNARLRSVNFTYSQFESALRSLHRMGKKVYVTVNTVFEQRQADRMYQLLNYLNSLGPDALIVQDFGVIAMVRSEFPSLKLHASTQMNIASSRGVNALSRHGISRVVLARELSLEELQSIRAETNMELEVFVHGALCISASGICLFSSYLGGKSANRGMCTQACRRLYQNASGGNGYYFSPNDLQLLERVPDLAAAGINALKIEGRMKSAAYVGAVVSAYRLVLDALMQGDENEIQNSIKKGGEILLNDFARPKTQFYFDCLRKVHTPPFRANKKGMNPETNTTPKQHTPSLQGGVVDMENEQSINWLNPAQDGGTGISLGTILKAKGTGGERCVLVNVSKEIIPSAGDSVRIHRKDDSGRITVKLSFVLPADNTGSKSTGKKPGGKSFWISTHEGAIGDSVYLIQKKIMSRRYAQLIPPHVLTHETGSRGPGREKAPPAGQVLLRYKQPDGKHSKSKFPEGLYVAVSRYEDLYIVQSSRPARVILSLQQKNIRHILKENNPPFNPGEIILSLDPYFPQGSAEYGTGKLAEEIKLLIEKGYLQYIVNNPGHFSLFRGSEKIKLIAGSWLYTFNSWSLSFIASLGVDGFVSPLENNRQNLERTLGIESRKIENKRNPVGKKQHRLSPFHSKYFITVFTWPPLFNIRANLDKTLNLKLFSDNREEEFFLVTGYEGSRVYPKEPFSIIDKIPFLKEAGFERFIIDLSAMPLKKQDYRDCMRMVKDYIPLPKASRFNWKDGFFSEMYAPN